MKVKNHASGGASGSGMEENPWSCSIPLVAVVRPSAEQTGQSGSNREDHAVDPSSPGLLSRLPDDGDGMGQARHPCALKRH
jgi:hypothetical protein